MRTTTIILTFVFSFAISTMFSQNNIKVREIIFIDEEFDLICDSISTTLVINEDFLRFDYRYLLFDIEIQALENNIDVDLSDFKICFSFSEDTIPLIDCGHAILTDSSVIFHAYCVVKDRMIPGGSKFVRDDVYKNYQHLQNTLQRLLSIIYSKSDETTQNHIKIPQITMISPRLSSGKKHNVRLDFCPCSEEIETIWK